VGCNVFVTTSNNEEYPGVVCLNKNPVIHVKFDSRKVIEEFDVGRIRVMEKLGKRRTVATNFFGRQNEDEPKKKKGKRSK
jgi:hypothetical protein